MVLRIGAIMCAVGRPVALWIAWNRLEIEENSKRIWREFGENSNSKKTRNELEKNSKKALGKGKFED